MEISPVKDLQACQTPPKKENCKLLSDEPLAGLKTHHKEKLLKKIF